MRGLLLIFIFIISGNTFANDTLLEFETDYCTNYPEGTKERPDLWKHCCLMHDMFFWAGGNKNNRDEADRELRSCIELTGAKKIARVMYAAVRLGSYSPIKYSNKKWNFGWPNRPTHQSLTSLDIDSIEFKIYMGHPYISQELKDIFIQTLRNRSE